jgi:TfoX/Sxy family transcriptional regulator of competence genes
MAYDQHLAERARAILAAAGQTPAEKKMFGGMSFLISGNMCCGVMGEDLLIRVGAEASGAALADPAARPFDMGRGPSPGWVVVAPGGTASDETLAVWVQQALAFVTTLPPKK